MHCQYRLQMVQTDYYTHNFVVYLLPCNYLAGMRDLILRQLCLSRVSELVLVSLICLFLTFVSPPSIRTIPRLVLSAGGTRSSASPLANPSCLSQSSMTIRPTMCIWPASQTIRVRGAHCEKREKVFFHACTTIPTYQHVQALQSVEEESSFLRIQCIISEGNGIPDVITP